MSSTARLHQEAIEQRGADGGSSPPRRRSHAGRVTEAPAVSRVSMSLAAEWRLRQREQEAAEEEAADEKEQEEEEEEHIVTSGTPTTSDTSRLAADWRQQMKEEQEEKQQEEKQTKEKPHQSRTGKDVVKPQLLVHQTFDAPRQPAPTSAPPPGQPTLERPMLANLKLKPSPIAPGRTRGPELGGRRKQPRSSAGLYFGLTSLLITLLLFVAVEPSSVLKGSGSAVGWLELSTGVRTAGLLPSSSPVTVAAAVTKAGAASGAAIRATGAQDNRATASAVANYFPSLHQPILVSSAGGVWVLHHLLLFVGFTISALSLTVHFWLYCRQSDESVKGL